MTDVNTFLFGNVDDGDDSSNSESNQIPCPDGRYSRWNNPRIIENRRKAVMAQESNRLNLKTFSNVTLESTKWIIDEWIPNGELTALVGLPGSGKSSLACAIAACVSRGESLLHPNFKCNKPSHVVIISNEDSASTLKARLKAAGADLDRVHLINAKKGKNGETPFLLLTDRDQSRLKGLELRLNDKIGLIILDPLSMIVDGNHACYAKVRQALESASGFAKEKDCAILGIVHTVKNPIGKDPLARIAGAAPMREVPRSIIMTGNIKGGPTESEGTHVMVHAKNNLGTTYGGFEYRLQEIDVLIPNENQNAVVRTVKVDITAERFGSAEDILQEADRLKPVKFKNKTDLAEEFLIATLKNGPKPLLEIEEMALQATITKGTLKLAKSNLKIKATKQKGDGRSIWSLPESAA